MEKKHVLPQQTLVSILGEYHYTPKEFLHALGAPTLISLLQQIKPKALPWIKALFKAKVYSHVPKLDRQFGKGHWEIQSYTFTYRSQTVDGREKDLSGRVTFLNNKGEGSPHQVKTLSLHMHQAFFDPEWAPSQNLMLMPLKVLWDSAVIEPDLQKWGINHGIEADGGGSAVHTARQLAHCTVAALEIMRQHGVTLAPDGYTINWGSSQGSVPTLHFAKWYDTEAPEWFKESLRLRSTFVGEGAMDMPEYIHFLSRHPEILNLGHIILVAYLKAFSPEQLGGYKPEEFVPQWYLDTKYQVDGREISFFDAVCHYYPQITEPVTQKMASFDQVFSPDMLTADGKVDFNSPKMRAWLSCLTQHNKLEEWTPAHDVYMAHSPKDGMIPYEFAHNLYLAVSNQGQNSKVHMMSVPFPRFIPTGGLNPHFVVAFLLQAYMAFVKDPKDMYRLFKSVK